jgi:hypothetical protein
MEPPDPSELSKRCAVYAQTPDLRCFDNPQGLN